MFIKVKKKWEKDLTMGIIYRPPGASLDVFTVQSGIDLLLSHLFHVKNDTCLAGDYNLDLLKSNTHAQTHTFFNVLTSYRFLTTILRPTRIASDTATLIDNIITDLLSDNTESAIIIHDISDHLPNLVWGDSVKTALAKPLTYEKIVSEVAKSELVSSLLNIDWSDVHCV